MELRNRISKVKKRLPNLCGRATQLPPIQSSTVIANSRRSLSTTNQLNGQNASKTFQDHLNVSSAGAIPLYASEEERQAVILPPLEQEGDGDNHRQSDEKIEKNEDSGEGKSNQLAEEETKEKPVEAQTEKER